MTKETLYTYLGTNGTVTTPVELEGVPSIKKVRLFADKGRALTKDGGKTKLQTVTVKESEVSQWTEI